MSILLALFLVVHASIHIGYICGPAWPFAAGDPWLVALCGADPDTVRLVGIALVAVSFLGYLLAAMAATGFVPSLWKPLIVVASLASAAVLVIALTAWTLPGIAVDAALLCLTLGGGWRPTPFFGRARGAASQSQEAAR
jgi:hypothetical protein